MNGDGNEARKRAIEALITKTMCTQDEAFEILKECEWNLEVALNRLVENDDSSVTPSTSGEFIIKLETPGYAFVLPDFERLPPDFRNFLERDLIEVQAMRRLEGSRHLNWWSSVGQKLWPLSTTGDGNCLLHAASLGMWGLHDRQLLLRNAVFEMLRKGSRRSALYRRWRWSEHRLHQATNLRLTDEEWATEWAQAIELAAPTPRKSEAGSKEETYESLEAIHVFALAHVLKRPIVVVSDTILRNAAGEELSPIPFGGVYLPLECLPEQCHRNPLVLCYDSAHFSPLVTMRMDSNLPQIIPITNNRGELLPVHFEVDPGSDFTWWRHSDDTELAKRIALSDLDKLGLMADYMDIVRIDSRRGSLRKARPVKNGFTAEIRSRSITGTFSQSKKRLLNELTHHVIRALRFGSSRQKCKTIDVKSCVLNDSPRHHVFAALLNPESHLYMDKMVSNYMKSARERFKNINTDGRKRISRSLSASSLSITCIAKECNETASPSTNFLCKGCFELQRQMMMSFSLTNPGAIRSLRPSATAKSSTMPMINSGQAYNAWLASSAALHSNHDSPLCPDEPMTTSRRFVELESADGQTNTTVRAVEDDDGITHYVVGSCSASSPLDAFPASSPSGTIQSAV